MSSPAEQSAQRFRQMPAVCMVTSVNAGKGAEGKLQPGDIILSVDNVRISSMNALSEALNKRYVGDTVTVQVYRNGSLVTVDVVLSAQTD